jgi:hypothetical protein
MHWSIELEKVGACRPAVEWARQYPTFHEAWQACPRGDWMLWLISRTSSLKGPALRKLVLAKARCGKLALHLMENPQSRRAVRMAERFGLGRATRKELDAAATAAIEAADLDGRIDIQVYAETAAAYAASVGLPSYTASASGVAVFTATALAAAADETVADIFSEFEKATWENLAEAARRAAEACDVQINAHDEALARCATEVRRVYPRFQFPKKRGSR